MTLIDFINGLTGATKQAKFGRIRRTGQSLEAIEEWIAGNIDVSVLEDYFQNQEMLAIAMDQGSQLVIRLQKRLDRSSIEGELDDLIQIAQELLLLKYIVAYDFGFRLTGEHAIRAQYPDLAAVADLDEGTLLMHVREAYNSLNYLIEKYPH